MKKLLLFALLASVPAFGQAYSDSVTQNSPGNYGRPVPYASVQVCSIGDTAVPCTQKTQTFTDDSLSVACTQSAGSGVLTGAPSSGANCNNPGIADANGNFTIYVAPGQYTICTYANNWLCQKVSIGGSGGGIPFACASAVNGSIVAMTSTTTSSCDPNGVTDFIGHWTSQSYRATGAFNGVVELTGGLADPTTVPDTNSFAFLAPLTVVTPFYLRPPGTVGTVGQCWGLLSQNVGTNGTIDAMGWQNCIASAGTVEAQTNGVDNANCTAGGCPLINLISGTNTTVTNPSGGVWRVDAAGASAPQALNPTAPACTTNGSAGSTSYSYLVQGCEDGPTCANHSAPTSACTIATGNATLTSSNSINLKTYADTLYGYRCYNIYRTASAGTPSSTGLIANCVPKQFIDTGLAGNSVSAPAGNTTVLDANGTTAPLPGCNKIPAAPWGIDGPPCTPNALDTEFTDTFQIAGINSPEWTWVNQNSATATLANGVVILEAPNRAGSDNLNCIVKPLPATPYNFVSLIYPNVNAFNTGYFIMAFYESGTGKLETIAITPFSGFQTTINVSRWTSVTALSSSPISNTNGTTNIFPVNFALRGDGTNIVFYSSPDGIHYQNQYSEAKNAFFGTAPDKVGFCIDNQRTSSGAATASMEIDYFRQVSSIP